MVLASGMQYHDEVTEELKIMPLIRKGQRTQIAQNEGRGINV